MRHFAAVLLLKLAVPVWAGNFAECILDKMPGVQNDVAARAVFQICNVESPGGIQSVKQGSRIGMFGYKSGAQCTAKKAGATRSNQGAFLIGTACRQLYDESEIDKFLR